MNCKIMDNELLLSKKVVPLADLIFLMLIISNSYG